MNKEKRIEILTRLRDNNPQPTTELLFDSPFELLISVLLSARATDVSVNKATRPLYAVANTPQAILDLGVDGVKSYIKTIGLFNTKAENVIKTCRMLVELHNGEVPEDRAALEALRVWGVKPPMWCSIPRSAGRPLLLIPIFSVSVTAQNLPRKNVDEVEQNYCGLFRQNLKSTAITGLYCTGVTPVLPANPAAVHASLRICVNSAKSVSGRLICCALNRNCPLCLRAA